jgi:hypothetical protein
MGTIHREQNLSLGFIHMFLWIYSSPRNTYHFQGNKIIVRKQEDSSSELQLNERKRKIRRPNNEQ